MKVSVGSNLTDEFEVVTGLKQGDALSLMLFNLVHEYVIRKVIEVNSGVELNDTHKIIGCLRCTVTDTNQREEEEIDISIQNALRCTAALHKVLEFKLIRRKIKIGIYKTVIRPILMYGCEAWTLKEKKMLVVTQGKILRKILGPTKVKDRRWRDKKNIEVQDLVSEPNIIEETKSSWASVARTPREDGRGSYRKESLILSMALVYSCCIWFSLRLGGLLIAVFSIMQTLIVLIACCVAYSQPQRIKNSVAAVINSMNLIYTRPYLESFHDDPENYLSFGISLSCIYIIVCFTYAYGAYTFKNIFMIGYILVELLRLIALAFFITTWLLVLKENTMDIGIQIGTSVVSFFFILGMFYLWICAANLPILINEMKFDQQAATISKLKQMLETQNSATNQGLQNQIEGVAPLDPEFSPWRKTVYTTGLEKNKIFKHKFEKESNTQPFHFQHFYH